MEQSSFFNSVDGDRQYDMEQFATYFKHFLSNGLYHTNNVPALLVTKGAGLKTIVDAGSAYVEGFMYMNTAPIELTHDAANLTNPRIDRVVVKLNRNVGVRAINVVVKKGTAATTPLPPTLQRDTMIYEISLAQVRINANATSITTVTDERLDPTVAGLVSSLITLPTDGFIADWNDFMSSINSIKDDYESDLTTWKSDLDADKAAYEAQWADWFSSVEIGTAAKGGMTISVRSTTPPSPIMNDIWIDTNA